MTLVENGFLLKLIKFALVGFTGVFVDFGITYLLKEKWRLSKYLANSAGFVIAATTNYTLNRWWTFQSHDPAVVQQFGKYFGIACIGLLISNLLVFALNEKLRWNFYFAKVLILGIVVIWNFGANYLYTFA